MSTSPAISVLPGESRVVQFCTTLGKACGIGAYTEKLADAFGFQKASRLEHLLGRPCSLLHLQHEFSILPTPLLKKIVRFCRRRGIPLVVTLHTVIPRSLELSWRSRALQECVQLENRFYPLVRPLLGAREGEAVSAPARLPGPSDAGTELVETWGRRLQQHLYRLPYRLAGLPASAFDRLPPRLLLSLYNQALVMRHADQIVVHNSSSREFLLEAGLHPDRVILYDLPLDRYDTSASLLSEEDGRRHVGYFGFLHPHKGILELIEACAGRQDIVLHLWASTAQEEAQSPFQRHVRERVAGLEGVRLETGHIPLKEAVLNLSRCDLNVLYLQPSANLYTSGSIRQYLAAGRPILASDVQAVEDLRSWLHLVPPGRVDLLKQAVGEAFAPPEGLEDYLEAHRWENSPPHYLVSSSPAVDDPQQFSSGGPLRTRTSREPSVPWPTQGHDRTRM